MSQYDYDVIVIGGGSGGIAFANRAASHRQRVLVVEGNAVGGTCVNVGCVPKKLMWYAATTADTIEQASGYGFDTGKTGHDWRAMVDARQTYIQNLHSAYFGGFNRNQVDYQTGYARFVDQHTVSIEHDDGQTNRSARHIVIATGGHPRWPDIPGAEYGMTSDEFFGLTVKPDKITIVGSGYIAVEFSSALASLGTEVTLMLRGDTVLRSFDTFLQDELMTSLALQGIQIFRDNDVVNVEKRGDNDFVLTCDKGQQYEANCLLWAVGREPEVQRLGLEQLDIKQDKQGYIKTDEYQQTSVDNIFAVGDVTGRVALTPVAIAAGRRLADRLYNNMPDRKVDYDNIATVIFTHPPLGEVGLTEAEARKQYDDVGVYSAAFTPMSHALLPHRVKGGVKLIVTGEDERIVGIHVFGPGADEMLQGFAVALRMGATKKDFDDTIAIHPTLSEELVTLKKRT